MICDSECRLLSGTLAWWCKLLITQVHLISVVSAFSVVVAAGAVIIIAVVFWKAIDAFVITTDIIIVVEIIG